MGCDDGVFAISSELAERCHRYRTRRTGRRQELDEGPVRVVAGLRGASQQDAPVGGDPHGAGLVDAAEVVGRDAVRAERGVEYASRGVANQRHVVAPGGVGVAAEQDLAVGRDHHLGRLFGAAEVGGGDAVTAAERGVHIPGGSQAGHRPVAAGVAADDDLAVRLQVHALQPVVGRGPQVEHVDAVAAEARVERSGRRVAGDEEVVGPRRVRPAGHEDLAVVLDVDGGDELATAAGVVDHLAAGTESRVQCAVRRVDPGQCQVPAVRARRVHPAADEDLAVGLERSRVAPVVVGGVE